MNLSKLLLLSSLMLLLVVPFAHAQPTVVRARIPFAFTVSGRELPAGEYMFTPNTNDEAVRVQGLTNRINVGALVVTKTAGKIHTSAQDAHIVFDKIGDKYILSEIWPAEEDGLVMHMTE
ncbi:MAG: hypothetical protein ABFD89_28695 [Bryobacteraceae bacterium]